MYGIWSLYTDTLIKMVFCIWIQTHVQINLSVSEANHLSTSQLQTELHSARLSKVGTK